MRDFQRSRICKVNDIFLIFIAYFVLYTEKVCYINVKISPCDIIDLSRDKTVGKAW